MSRGRVGRAGDQERCLQITFNAEKLTTQDGISHRRTGTSSREVDGTPARGREKEVAGVLHAADAVGVSHESGVGRTTI